MLTITSTEIDGLHVIRSEPKYDERGYFARTFCKRELASAGIDFDIQQTSISFNARAGTLRGLHYQKKPSAESKIITCFAGKAFDVCVDLRPDSPSYLQVFSTELSATNFIALCVPPGIAHGFQTLEDETSVFYCMSSYYDSQLDAGIRWNDPRLRIAWPTCDQRIISARDQALPLLQI